MKDYKKCSLSISRPSYGDGREKISIRVKDESSRIEFLEIEIDLVSFAKAITGLSEVKCEMVTRRLEHVGKTEEIDKLEFEIPEHTYTNREEVTLETALKLCPDSWTLDPYLGSKDSFSYKDGKEYCRVNIFRYV